MTWIPAPKKPPGPLIIHNTARANITNNYEVAAGNFLGTIITTTASMNAAPNTYGNLSF